MQLSLLNVQRISSYSKTHFISSLKYFKTNFVKFLIEKKKKNSRREELQKKEELLLVLLQTQFILKPNTMPTEASVEFSQPWHDKLTVVVRGRCSQLPSINQCLDSWKRIHTCQGALSISKLAMASCVSSTNGCAKM